MKKMLTIFIGFTHDFAVACWAATVLAIYRLNLIETFGGLKDLLFQLKREFFYIGLACVAIVMLTGMGRTFTYIGNIFGEESEKTRRRILIIKHVVLFTVFGIGIYWQYLMVYGR